MAPIFSERGDLLLWRDASWSQRLKLSAIYLGMGILTIIGAAVILTIVGMSLEGYSMQKYEHDRCLKRATNGFEIRECR